MKIPSFVLRKLYVKGSLATDGEDTRFRLRNTLAGATLTGLTGLKVDGKPFPVSRVRFSGEGREVSAAEVREDNPQAFPRDAEVEVRLEGLRLGGHAKVRLEAMSAEFGELTIEFDDDVPS